MEAAKAVEALKDIVEKLDIEEVDRVYIQRLIDDVETAVYDTSWYTPVEVVESYKRKYGDTLSEEEARAIAMAATVEATGNLRMMRSRRYYLDRGCALYHQNHSAE